MSQMTQRRQTRRATRKQAELRRMVRRKNAEVNGLVSNLRQAVIGLERQRAEIKELKAKVAA